MVFIHQQFIFLFCYLQVRKVLLLLFKIIVIIVREIIILILFLRNVTIMETEFLTLNIVKMYLFLFLMFLKNS